jgi:hypothetical protein
MKPFMSPSKHSPVNHRTHDLTRPNSVRWFMTTLLGMVEGVLTCEAAIKHVGQRCLEL